MENSKFKKIACARNIIFCMIITLFNYMYILYFNYERKNNWIPYINYIAN
jgi:hypothetical protein